MNLILKPFALLLVFFYNLFNNYGVALIFFAFVVKLILFPFSLKGKKSMVKMSAVQGKANRIQKQYANNKERQQQELAKLYEQENVNPMGGCLWSFLPLLILIPLYAIIRQPLLHMMDMTVQQIMDVGNNVLNWAQVSVDRGWVRAGTDVTANLLTESSAKAGDNQLYMASLIDSGNLSAVQAIAPDAFIINFRFLGMDLSVVPTWKFWTQPLTWNNIGLTLMPLVSAGLALLMSIVTQKTNKMSNPAAEQQNNNTFMLYVFSPLMSLWIGYVMPAGLCVYWIINSLLSMVQEVVSGRMLKKDYEEAAENARKQALLDKEEEKRRKAALSAERAKRAEEKKQQKGKKKEKTDAAGVDASASRVGLRAYARGRAYDPDRFGGVTPYRDPDHPVDEDAVEQARAEKAQRREEAQLEADVTAQVAAEMAQLEEGTADEVEKAIQELDQQRVQELEAEADALAAGVTDASDEGDTADEADEPADEPAPDAHQSGDGDAAGETPDEN